MKTTWSDFRDDFENLKVHGEEEKLYPYCNLLFLQFKEPQVYDMSIPRPYHIYSLVNAASRILSGENDIKGCFSSHDCYNGILEFDKMNQSLGNFDLSKKLYLSLHEFKDDYSSVLGDYMKSYKEIFRTEWVMMRGDWYEFREGKRAKIEEEVMKLLPKEEIEKVKILGDTIQPLLKNVMGGWR